MSLLHAYFNLRRQTDFQRCLEQSKATASTSTGAQLSTGSGSGPGARSWTKQQTGLMTPIMDVNARDWLGRAVLHLSCSSNDAAALEYTRLLLAHPYINVNIQDQESLWTPLHRALYVGNISAAVLLLQRADVDIYIKDSEGYTPFDLYNSTVDGTNPAEGPESSSHTELYTWGSNRNANLGLGDGDDRTMPEQVIVKRVTKADSTTWDRLKPVPIVNIYMSKFHTTVITAEAKGNVRSCGFSSSGRLGSAASKASHTQFSLTNPQETLPHRIITLALGQDHTLAVTSEGEVLSWGLNRFSQLGYALEGKTSQEEQIQAAARKVTGPLRNQVVLGVACSKSSSACWTASQLYTWGTNHGQLGYEKAGKPQVLPRPVAYITEPVVGVAMTDYAMLVLLKSQDVICVHDGDHWRLQFTSSQRSQRSARLQRDKVDICKVTACEGSSGSFALMSKAGDVYLFNIDENLLARKETTKELVNRRPVPHLVWGVRKQFTAVKDVALGSDGSMILCTKSGHVFVRKRVLRATITGFSPLVNPPKSAPLFKFHRIHNLQRIIKVCANSTGAFAALRLDATARPIPICLRGIGADFDNIQPFRSWTKSHSKSLSVERRPEQSIFETIEQSKRLIGAAGDDDDLPDVDVAHDIRVGSELRGFLENCLGTPTSDRTLHPLWAHHGADILLHVGEYSIPAHQILLFSRVSKLRGVLSGKPLIAGNITIKKANRQNTNGFSAIQITGCSPISVLLICHYLYSDNLACLWDRRVAMGLMDQFSSKVIDPMTLRAEIQTLASSMGFDLPEVEQIAQLYTKRTITSTLPRDIQPLLNSTSGQHDIRLRLSDGTIQAHSFVLRARCLFFSTFFDEKCWSEKRYDLQKGGMEVDLSDFSTRPMAYLLRYLYGYAFSLDDLAFIQSSAELIDFLFDIIACSVSNMDRSLIISIGPQNHLLIDPLTDICSMHILQVVNLQNIASILVEASHLNAVALVHSIHNYIAENLESLMETHALLDLPHDILRCLSSFIAAKQRSHHPHIRTGGNLPVLEQRWAKWIQRQDIPMAFAPRYLSSGRLVSTAATLQPFSPTDTNATSQPISTTPKRLTSAKSSTHVPDDDIFPMDNEVGSGTSLGRPGAVPQQASPTVSRTWKSPTVTGRIDMKTIMESQKEASEATIRPSTSSSPRASFPLSSSKKSQNTYSQTPPAHATLAAEKAATQQQGTLKVVGSPWRVPAQASDATGVSRTSASPWRPTGEVSPPKATTSMMRPSTDVVTRPTQQAPLLNAEKPPGSKLGPLIVPEKTKSTPIVRQVSGDGQVWSRRDPGPSASHSPSTTVSFATIQEQQATKLPPRGPPKSIREIQDEEQEVAFLAWFEEETARVKKQEEDALVASMASTRSRDESNQGKRGNQNKRGRGPRGRGRGHNQRSQAVEVAHV